MQLTAQRPDPVLAIDRTNGGVAVSWQASLGCRLQSATSLEIPDAWSTMIGSPTLFQGRNIVTNNILDGIGYYRLVRP